MAREAIRNSSNGQEADLVRPIYPTAPTCSLPHRATRHLSGMQCYARDQPDGRCVVKEPIWGVRFYPNVKLISSLYDHVICPFFFFLSSFLHVPLILVYRLNLACFPFCLSLLHCLSFPVTVWTRVFVLYFPTLFR